MKSNYLPRASALLNSRIPSLQVSNPPGHQVSGWRTMTLAHPPLPPPNPCAVPGYIGVLIKCPSKCERH